MLFVVITSLCSVVRVYIYLTPLSLNISLSPCLPVSLCIYIYLYIYLSISHTFPFFLSLPLSPLLYLTLRTGFPLDTPRLTMQSSLIELFKKNVNEDGVSLMEDFQYDLVTAFAVLRRHQHALISFAKVALCRVYKPHKVQKFMWGNHSFHTHASEREALEWFEDKVLSQLSMHVFRRGAKHALVKAYYAAVSMM